MTRFLPMLILPVFVVGIALSGPSAGWAFPGSDPQAGWEAGHFCTGAIQPPIDLALEVSRVTETAGDAGTVDLLLKLTPLTESVRVMWEVSLPPGLSALSGSRDGLVPVRMGEQLTRSLSLSVPDGKRYYLYARAVLETESGDLYTRAVSRVIDLGSPDVTSPPFTRSDAVRGDVVSFRGVQLEGGER